MTKTLNIFKTSLHLTFYYSYTLGGIIQKSRTTNSVFQSFHTTVALGDRKLAVVTVVISSPQVMYEVEERKNSIKICCETAK